MIDIGNQLNICYETFGSYEHEPILLLMGTGLQGILWPDDFCNDLAQHHFYVIRYDYRDTGLSSCIDYEKKHYADGSCVDDAFRLLDKLKIKKVHIVGLSMGGHLAQLMAIYHPKRLLTSTLIMSTPHHMVFLNAVLAGKNTPNTSLSKPYNELIEFFSKPFHDVEDREKSIDYSLATWKLFNGQKADFDEASWRILLTKQYERTINPYARINHRKACLASSEDRTPLLKKIQVSTLIIHGLDDPLFPVDHGKALATAIPNSKLLIIENMGHALNRLFQNQIVNAMAAHMKIF